MKLTRYLRDGVPEGGIWHDNRIIGIQELNARLGIEFPTDTDMLIQGEGLSSLSQLVGESRSRLDSLGFEPDAKTLFLSIIARPPKIWCIGLNYVEHAGDLDESAPEAPASFMRPGYSMVGPGDPIRLPEASERVTGEAELAVVLGSTCRDLTEETARGAIAGFVPAIDMTAEDILRQNPRFLTRSKSFDSFLSLGHTLVTPDELGPPDAITHVRTSTILNGDVHRTNTVSHMRHQPYELLAFHSRGMTWCAGDLLLTGTPGAVHLKEGDVIAANVEGVGRLENPVRLA